MKKDMASLNINKVNYIQNIDIKNVRKINKNNYNREIYNILNNMTLEEKIGQLLLVRVPIDNKIEVIKKYNIGGYLLFQRDIDNKSKKEIINEIKEYQTNSKIPLFIAIDEEGGTVSRLNANKNIVSNLFLSPKELYIKGGYSEIKKDAKNKNDVLSELGININLAPVADVVINESSYMYDRSFSKDSKKTSKYVKNVVSTQTKEVSYVLKHFPGYGDNVDTHINKSIDNRSYDYLKKNDFLPFSAGIKKGVDGILVSHNIVTSIDTSICSLSIKCHNIIRNEFDFNGIIITDSLDMKAVNNYNQYVEAVLSGNNILIVTDYEKAYNDIYISVKNEILSEELINKLVYKNLELKNKKELF